jgi:hypothetical protein
MPHINFAWFPKADSSRVSGIIDNLRALADAHNVSFYLNAKEEEEAQPVVLNNGVSVPTAVMDELRALAARGRVTIYVHAG